MSAQYWLARYVEDPFRNEPKNIGVIVRLGDAIAGRFVGEIEENKLDGRSIKRFAYPNVYTQWHDYWRSKLSAAELPDIMAASTPNFFVQSGGEVSDVMDDSVHNVCDFLFKMLVGGGPQEAYDWNELGDEVRLSAEIVSSFEVHHLLDRAGLWTRHPILRERPITGRSVTHVPSFSQRNGRLYVIEHIDLSGTRTNKIKERAGWMAYMFSDIRDYERDVVAYSLVRPADGKVPDIEFANTVLEKSSLMVNWTDEAAKNEFLTERERIANAL